MFNIISHPFKFIFCSLVHFLFAFFFLFQNEPKGYLNGGGKDSKCRRPNTHESTRTRLAHGSQACDGGGSTGEGDHPGILHAVDISFCLFVFFFSSYQIDSESNN